MQQAPGRFVSGSATRARQHRLGTYGVPDTFLGKVFLSATTEGLLKGGRIAPDLCFAFAFHHEAFQGRAGEVALARLCLARFRRRRLRGSTSRHQKSNCNY
jgi:hypothetical protein